MSVNTQWGYTITDSDRLEDMLTKEEYDEFTANKYQFDDRTTGNIKAASKAIRDYCGWHVYPSCSCRIEMTFYDKRISLSDGCVLIQLPAGYVSEIQSVTIGETEHEQYVLESGSILRLYNMSFNGIYKHTPVVVEYAAGLDDAMMDSIKELVSHRVTHALSSTSGVQSETAGGMSITYNASWTNNSRATALADDNKEVLQVYRVKGVF